MSFSLLHKTGKVLGFFLFAFVPKFRKRSLSNLALATSLNLSCEEIKRIAKKSLGSLLITSLEYAKLSTIKRIESIVQCINPQQADSLLAKGKGIIFFCAHQANWELFFLEGTSRMPGVAIGQPIANTYLYNWILKIRQQFGGKIISPQQAVKEGLRALKKGAFLGIVGDQGMPETGFSSLFFGRKAFTSPLPALLAYRSSAPLIVATMKRDSGMYQIHYSPALFPDPSKTSEEEVPRLMQEALLLLEESIRQKPEEWLWSHNKWKQQGPKALKRAYRYDAMAIILPSDLETLSKILKALPTFRQIYPQEHITVFAPEGSQIQSSFAAELKFYSCYEQIKTKDYRFKLLFNFTEDKSLSRYFLKLAVFKSVSLSTLEKALPKASLSDQLKQMILYAR
jgi:KDO2-lipid IV(A) lauroyltransferase